MVTSRMHDKAQACLNEVFRAPGPYEDRMRIPITSDSESNHENVSESYAELKENGRWNDVWA
jgi:hypothetical protein